MIADSNRFPSRYRIPLGRKTVAKKKMGFNSSDYQSPIVSKSMIRAPFEKHLLTIAPTGAGKFRSMLAPELLTYPGPIVCVDIKGEAYSVTARRRKELGNRIVRLDPFGVIGSHSDSLNFFDLFKLPNSDLETDAQMISSIISESPSIARDPFWDISARGLITGLLVYLVQHRPGNERILSSLRRLLYADDTDYKIAVVLDTVKDMHPLAHGELCAYLSQPERETRPSVLATARSYFKALFSERVEATFAESSFSLADIANSEPITVYLVVPPNKLESHRRMLRLWMTTLMSAIMSRRQIPDWPTLFLVDEASQLGNFPPLVQAITLGRGYGVRVHSFWQDLTQLMLCYPTEWRTIINNCGVKQIFGMSDPFMAQGLDDLFQVHTRDITSLSRMQQWIMRNGKTTQADKLDYLTDPAFAGMFDANPYHGGDWPDIKQLEPEKFLPKCLPPPPDENRIRTNDEDDLDAGICRG